MLFYHIFILLLSQIYN